MEAVPLLRISGSYDTSIKCNEIIEKLLFSPLHPLPPSGSGRLRQNANTYKSYGTLKS